LTNRAKKPTKIRVESTGGGRGRTRTGTPVSQKQILSLLCLPFHHAATRRRCITRGCDRESTRRISVQCRHLVFRANSP
jgi:hypothetical protein